MNFLEDFFDAFHFTDEQKRCALKDLELLFKAKVSSDLISKLPKNTVPEGTLTDEDRKHIASVLKDSFQPEHIRDEETSALGSILGIYIGYMLENASDTERKKAEAVLGKYNLVRKP